VKGFDLPAEIICGNKSDRFVFPFGELELK